MRLTFEHLFAMMVAKDFIPHVPHLPALQCFSILHDPFSIIYSPLIHFSVFSVSLWQAGIVPRRCRRSSGALFRGSIPPAFAVAAPLQL